MPERGLLAIGVAFWCLVGCGGKEFSSGAPSGSGGSAGSKAQGGGGSNDQGGSDGGIAGDVATGGSATGGKAGSGGSGPVGCDCPAGSYCRDGSTDCKECTVLTRLSFRAPEKLATLSDGSGSRFPRVGATGTDLLYQFSGVGLRYTTDSSTSAGNSVAQTMPDDGAPLLLPANIGTMPAAMVTPFNFVFDRLVEEDRRELYFGQWSGGLMSPVPAPAPYNLEGTSNFGLAIAPHELGGAARAYWMTDRLQPPAISLVTALLSLDMPDEVSLNIGDSTCPALAEDLTPWVTPNGATLFFSHTRLGSDCTAQSPAHKDIYWSYMSTDTGQPIEDAAAATLLNDVNSPANDVDPSFSADFCYLYFTSDRDGENALYRAHRR